MDVYNVYLGDGLRNPMSFRDYEKHPYGSWEKSVGSYYQQNKSYNLGKCLSTKFILGNIYGFCFFSFCTYETATNTQY